MEWGDYIEDGPCTLASVIEDSELIALQMKESIPLLQGFDPSKSFRIHWRIEEI